MRERSDGDVEMHVSQLSKPPDQLGYTGAKGHNKEEEEEKKKCF